MPRRIEALEARRTDRAVTEAKLATEVYRRIAQSESVRYAIGAMQPIDPEYTKKTFEEGNRVRDQLDRRLTVACDYEYQGSVTNDTHIRAQSDIDLLAIIKKFYSLEPPQKPTNPYQGDPIKDLIELRNQVASALSQAFPEASVDDSGSKSIAIKGGSLRRKVDVVPSNWYDTNLYAASNNKVERGIHIFDAAKGERLANTPFRHNAFVSYRDMQTNGGLRKAARLMKSLKYDSDGKVRLSSYDIVSIAYNISDAGLEVPAGGDLVLVDSCLDYCRALESNATLRNSIDVPDQHRKVFAEGYATLTELQALTRELIALQTDILVENQRSFRRLAEARVDY